MTRLMPMLITTIALTLLSSALPLSSQAKGPPIVPKVADPAVGVREQLIPEMLITGRNLPASAGVVFIYNNVDDPEDPQNGVEGQVYVDVDNGGTVTQIDDSTLYLTKVKVKGDATIGSYDIEVFELSSDRRGKGTTLFKVQSKDQDPPEPCDAFVKDAASCDCQFYVRKETNDSGTPPLSIYGLINHCTTSETLVIPQFHQLQSYSPRTGDDSFRRSITAVNKGVDSEGNAIPFEGSAIIAAEGHRARLLYIDLAVGAGVETGCGKNLQSAVRFVLDQGSKNPTDPEPDSGYPRTRWLISSLKIGEGSGFCHGIEAIRTPYYPYTGSPESLVEISGSILYQGSWEQTGIRLEGFDWWPDSLRVPDISFNVIEPQAAGAGQAASAIEVGPVGLAGTGVIDAVVEENDISMAGAGAGIVVYGGPQMGAVINKNTVSGAKWGVLIDGNVVDANLAGNTLIGDNDPDGDSGDRAVCTDTIDTTDKGKPNRISGYDNGYNDIVLGCYP